MEHKLRTDIILADRDTHELFSDKMRFIFIELPSFDKEEEQCENDFERWIYVLKNMETLQRMPFRAQKAVFEKLEKVMMLASLSRAERAKYDESLKILRDKLSEFAYAKEEGKAEEKLEIASNAKLAGLPIETIVQITGLSAEEIEQL